MQELGKFIAAVALIVVCGVSLLLLQRAGCEDEGALVLEHSGWQRGIAHCLLWINESVQSLGKFPQLARQNIALMEKNSSLEAECVRLQALERENRELRQLLGMRQKGALTSVSAEVIARDPQKWFAQVIVDKGSAEGVTERMVAVGGGGLVGKVCEVQEHCATVRLLFDERSVVPVRLAGSGAAGVLYGSREQNCLARYFHQDTVVKDGEKLLTSGLGDIYPAGIVVGQVVAKANRRDSLYQEFGVRVSADLGSLQYVTLLQR